MLITPISNHKSPYFGAYEKTFVMLKPDSFQRGLDGKIMDGIHAAGLSVLKQWSGVPPRAKMEANYAAHKEKSFFQDWIDYLVSGKIKAMVLGGDDAILKSNNLKKAIRAEFAPGEKRFNLIHSSDDATSAEQEIAKFFDCKA